MHRRHCTSYFSWWRPFSVKWTAHSAPWIRWRSTTSSTTPWELPRFRRTSFCECYSSFQLCLDEAGTRSPAQQRCIRLMPLHFGRYEAPYVEHHSVLLQQLLPFSLQLVPLRQTSSPVVRRLLSLCGGSRFDDSLARLAPLWRHPLLLLRTTARSKRFKPPLRLI